MSVYFYLIKEGNKFTSVENKIPVFCDIRHSNFFISDLTESSLFTYTGCNLMIFWKLEFRCGFCIV